MRTSTAAHLAQVCCAWRCSRTCRRTAFYFSRSVYARHATHLLFPQPTANLPSPFSSSSLSSSLEVASIAARRTCSGNCQAETRGQRKTRISRRAVAVANKHQNEPDGRALNSPACSVWSPIFAREFCVPSVELHWRLCRPLGRRQPYRRVSTRSRSVRR